MDLKARFATFSSRTTSTFLRKLGRGGTNLPGRIAKKIDFNILTKLSKPVKIIIVTGTNGKTTTTKMIGQILDDAGVKYFTNKSGANIQTGIIAAFAEHVGTHNKHGYTHALIECDEAAFRQISTLIKTDYVVVTNIFRDQLDRFGEVSNTLAAIKTAVKNQPGAKLCLNADCSLTSSIVTEKTKNEVLWFGTSGPLYKKTSRELSDAAYCINCQHPYKYHYQTFAHLGDFYCPHCGYKRKDPNIKLTKIVKTDLESSTFKVKSEHEFELTLNLPGAYNIYNALAALALARAMEIPDDLVEAPLEKTTASFGRTENIMMGKTPLKMLLVKNPAGYNQVINLVINSPKKSQAIFALNDRIADGTDISWIWDVDFETLAKESGKYFEKIYLTGIRAADLAMRFEYAGFDMKKVAIVEDYDELLDSVAKSELETFIFQTYTAMFEIRRKIAERVDLKEFYD